jgi:hypothetical protein
MNLYFESAISLNDANPYLNRTHPVTQELSCNFRQFEIQGRAAAIPKTPSLNDSSLSVPLVISAQNSLGSLGPLRVFQVIFGLCAKRFCCHWRAGHFPIRVRDVAYL